MKVSGIFKSIKGFLGWWTRGYGVYPVSVVAPAMLHTQYLSEARANRASKRGCLYDPTWCR